MFVAGLAVHCATAVRELLLAVKALVARKNKRALRPALSIISFDILRADEISTGDALPFLEGVRVWVRASLNHAWAHKVCDILSDVRRVVALI